MMPVRILNGVKAQDASPLAQLLINGPARRHLEVKSFERHQRSTEHWVGIANLLDDGAMGVVEGEHFLRKGDDETFGLLRLAMEWLVSDQPRTDIPSQINQVHLGPEWVAMALLNRGVQPIDSNDEEVLLEMALRGGSMCLFKRLYAHASELSKQHIAQWLTHGRAFGNSLRHGNGAQLLARGGRVELLAHLIDTGVVNVDARHPKTGGLAHHAQHAATIEMLAGRGLDPTLINASGLQAPQAWVMSVHRGQNQVGMRNAWFRHYEHSGGVISHAIVARQSLEANLLVAGASLLGLDHEVARDATGLVDGRSLPEIAARAKGMGALGRHNQNPFFKPSNEGARLALKGVDMTRQLSCGASEGFHYALAFHGETSQWGTLASWAYESSPERELTLTQQRERVASIARQWSGDSEFTARYEGLLGCWWELLRDQDYDQYRSYETLLFLGEPDPNHPHGASMAQIKRLTPDIREQATRAAWAVGADVGREIGENTPHPQAWMDLALRLFPDEVAPGAAAGPESTYFLDTTVSNGHLPPVFTRMLVALMDRKTVPLAQTFEQLDEHTHYHIQKKAGMFHQVHLPALELQAQAARAQGQRRPRRI